MTSEGERGSPNFSTTLIGCLVPLAGHQAQNPSARTRHRRQANAVRKPGLSARVSAQALTIRLPTDNPLAQEGTSPQRRYSACRPFWFLTAGTGCAGEM